MNTLIPFLYVSFTGCLDPKINVDVNIERVEDTASDSTDVDNNSQPSSEPSQPANEPTGDPNDDGGGGDPNDGGGGDPNDPNDGGGGDPNDPNDGGGGDPNDPNDPNDGGGGDPNDPNDGGGGDPTDPPDDEQVPQDPNGGDGSGESFTADICEWWLSCATGENNPGAWGQDYAAVDQGCFSNHNNVSDSDQLTWFECVESAMGSGTATGADTECSDVMNCGNPW
ncbi:MAG: hypothetical protein VX278_11405 [Myxococcota bacterium]|nr:hypothetical protein [Myxococcota bacterium]